MEIEQQARFHKVARRGTAVTLFAIEEPQAVTAERLRGAEGGGRKV
jgi:hypothetical protein